ncbi:glycosyltransferase [Candidatus Bipolaricaulota bacterium]
MSRLPRVLQLNNCIGEGAGPFARVTRIDPKRFQVTICSYYDEECNLESVASQTTYRVIGLGARKRIDFRVWGDLWHLIRDGHFDIIHTHHNLMGMLGMLLGKLASIPVLVHSVGTMYSRLSILTKLFHMITFLLADSVVCVSRSVKESFGLFSRTLLKKKLAVIRNGIDVSGVESYASFGQEKRAEWGFGPQEFVIGNVARLIPLKDQETLIRAVSQAYKRHSNIRLLIIGRGRLKKSLEKLARNSGLEKSAIFAGNVIQTEVYRTLYALDMFVMTSLWEGLSAAVLEAMGAELPVILTDIPSFRETIEDRVSGRLVPTKDVDALSSTIKEMMDNPREAREMGKAAKERVIRTFSIKETAEAYEALYRELLSRKGI